MSSPTKSLPQVVAQIIDLGEAEVVSLRDVLEEIGNASFAPVLLLPALAVATPLSGIPLFSSLMGIVIFLIAGQMILRRKHPWLPDWVLRREVKGERLRSAFGYVQPVAKWVDKWTRRRLRWLIHRPFVFVPQLLCVLSGLVMPVLEFVPFSSSIMGTGVALMALGMMARDGVVVILGTLPYAAVGWLVLSSTA